MGQDTVVDAEHGTLTIAQAEARAFLAMTHRQRLVSPWLRYLRDDRASRSFFSGDPLRSTAAFSSIVAALVAKAYLDCDNAKEHAAPTGTEVKAIQASAFALESKLEIAASWLIADGASQAFRGPLRRLRENPSRLPPRTAGRAPLLKRRTFVLGLAESLCELTSTMPVGLLAVATSIAWQETSDRTIREILTAEVRDLIAAQAAACREARSASENESHLVISRVSVRPHRTAEVIDARSDSEKVAEALLLLKSLTDRIAAVAIIEAVTGLADEFGI